MRSSSLIYEGTSTAMQDEQTPFCPQSIYGMTKLDGLLLCRYYRHQYGVFASSGIINHESPYRRDNFISSRIIKAALDIKKGKQDSLVLGDLSAEVDWGYAPDYVEAMHRILDIDKADEFIIASGKKHSVRDFVPIAFDLLGLNCKQYVREDPGVVNQKKKSAGRECSKIDTGNGLAGKVDFRGMIKLLLAAQGTV